MTSVKKNAIRLSSVEWSMRSCGKHVYPPIFSALSWCQQVTFDEDIVLDHRNCLQLHMNKLCWFRVNQSLFFFLNVSRESANTN